MVKSSSQINIGVSSCLLGNKVRYDGQHKRSTFITNLLKDYVNLIPVCPEVAIGLGVPRPAIHIAKHDGQLRLVATQDETVDVTDKMQAFSAEYCQNLETLSGFIVKSKSPTCGMERVKIYQDNGQVTNDGVGFFAEQLIKKNPALPVEEEGRLNDPHLRENFFERVFAYYRWQQVVGVTPSAKRLIEFHTMHKYALLAHSQQAYQVLGQQLATIDKDNIHEFAQSYLVAFMQAMKGIASHGGHANVLQHCLGYLKQDLDQHDKQEMLEIIEQYRLSLVPLVVPITLLRHHFLRHPNEYIVKQTYLNPYPAELMLRNSI